MTIIEVELFEPTNSRYPLFNYDEIQRKLGIFDDQDNDILRDQDAEKIVKQLEAKYSNRSTKKRSANFTIEDVMDKGMGYDLDDDFIDDTQAYDEWVPSMMDTEKGGHYVNKGTLEFRQMDCESESSRSSTKTLDEESEGRKKTSSDASNINENIKNSRCIKRSQSQSGDEDKKIVYKSDVKTKSKQSINNTGIIRLSAKAAPPSKKIINAALSRIRSKD